MLSHLKMQCRVHCDVVCDIQGESIKSGILVYMAITPIKSVPSAYPAAFKAEFSKTYQLFTFSLSDGFQRSFGHVNKDPTFFTHPVYESWTDCLRLIYVNSSKAMSC